ncbi:MAG: enoyl-CoA hydratase/isomerase family protein [Gammaproteobacteria bacterium]|nr:enoyl-CoA hydratase/isomerase family protein [Gammaproteobacteria bacterium]
MQKVLFEKRGQLAYVTINRPERLNACDEETYNTLAATWRQVDGDAELRVGILTGAGERAFCAGSDIRSESFGQPGRIPGGELFPAMNAMTKPIIAAIHGHCNGGGLEQALACDIRVAADDAKFGLGEVLLGVLPGGGGTQRLPRLIPLGRALEMLYTGERIDAAEALRLGLVDHVVPRAELMAKCESIAEGICRGAPLAVQKIREAALRGLDLPLAEGLELERANMTFLRTTEDSKEGAAAFAEKRPPNWQGR